MFSKRIVKTIILSASLVLIISSVYSFKKKSTSLLHTTKVDEYKFLTAQCFARLAYDAYETGVLLSNHHKIMKEGKHVDVSSINNYINSVEDLKLEGWDIRDIYGKDYQGKESVFGVMGINEEKRLVIIATRGTSNMGDWQANIDTRSTKLNNPGNSKKDAIKVARGFAVVHESMTDNIYEILKHYMDNPSVSYKDFTFIFVGHSQGGALATLNAWWMLTKILELDKNSGQVILITNASPRVVSKESHKKFSKRFGDQYSIRLVNKPDSPLSIGDIVPALGPGTLTGLKHVGTEIRFNAREGWNVINWHDNDIYAEKAYEAYLGYHGQKYKGIIGTFKRFKRDVKSEWNRFRRKIWSI
jgi:hypothetical protein